MTVIAERRSRCADSQVYDLMQMAYQLGISEDGVICRPYGAERWADLSPEDAEAVLWSLRAALLHDLAHGGKLREPESRFYEIEQRRIESRTLAAWRRQLAGYTNEPPF